MNNKYVKRYSTSCHPRNANYTAMRYYYISIKRAKIQNTNYIRCWQGCGTTGTFTHCQWPCRMVYSLSKIVCYLKKKQQQKLCMLLPYDPAIALFGTYPKELKTHVHKKFWMYIHMGFSGGSDGKEMPEMQVNWVRSLGREDLLK